MNMAVLLAAEEGKVLTADGIIEVSRSLQDFKLDVDRSNVQDIVSLSRRSTNLINF